MSTGQTLLILSLLVTNVPASAESIVVGDVQRIATRDEVSVPIYAYWRSDAVATVVLFSGGGGGYGKIGVDGWPASTNFLVRTGKRWASHPFNVVMVGRPSDGIDLALGSVRTGEKHASDNLAVLKAIRSKSALPIWVVGTSMGTISAAAAAIRDRERLISGVVLTSSVVAYRIPGAVPTQELERIQVPTLVFHHERDACWSCLAHEARNIVGELKNAPIKKAIFVNGGSNPTGDPCEPMHYHGYAGMADEAVDLLAAWIIKPAE